MSAEHATSRRGLWASFTNAGAPCGMVLSTVVLTVTAAASGAAFLAWGWRVPFLLSILLLGSPVHPAQGRGDAGLAAASGPRASRFSTCCAPPRTCCSPWVSAWPRSSRRAR